MAALREDRALVRAKEAEWTDVVERHVEAKGEMQVTPDFLLTARADRLDVLAGGGARDHRLQDRHAALVRRRCGRSSPQLPLEGLIARAGGFEGIAAAEPARIVYYRLSGRGDGGEMQGPQRADQRGTRATVTLAETLATDGASLGELVAHFAEPDAEYPVQQDPKAAPHLCRRLRSSRAHLRVGRRPIRKTTG